MNKILSQFCSFLHSYAKSHPQCTKDEISKAAAKGLSFEYGEKADMPKDGKGRFAIIVAG